MFPAGATPPPPPPFSPPSPPPPSLPHVSVWSIHTTYHIIHHRPHHTIHPHPPHQLLLCLLGYVAKEKGYSGVRPLLLDHLRWLLYEWMEPYYGTSGGTGGGGNGGNDNEGEEDQASSPVSPGTVSQGRRGGGGRAGEQSGGASQSRSSATPLTPLLDLSVFPYQLLCPQGASLADFMRMYGSILLPLICQGNLLTLTLSRYPLPCPLLFFPFYSTNNFIFPSFINALVLLLPLFTLLHGFVPTSPPPSP